MQALCVRRARAGEAEREQTASADRHSFSDCRRGPWPSRLGGVVEADVGLVVRDQIVSQDYPLGMCDQTDQLLHASQESLVEFRERRVH
jgi:hypothetical protein